MSVPQWNADIITPEEEGSGTKVLDGNQVVQPTLEGGTNITISDGTISATGGGAEYYAGEGIVISNENAISITETVRDGAALGATSVQPADLSGYVLASSLATVATSGDYDDLLDKPTIPTVDQTYNAASTNAQSGTAVASALSGKQDTISDLETIRSGAAAGATAVQPSSLATVATTGNYSDLSGKPTIPTVDQTYNSASTNAQSGVAVASAIAGISVDEVPTVTSSDDGKVLKATYSGGTGSYAWATESGGASYTAGDGIDIDQNNEVSVKAGTGLAISDISSTVTENLSCSEFATDSEGTWALCVTPLTQDILNAINTADGFSFTTSRDFEAWGVDVYVGLFRYSGNNPGFDAVSHVLFGTALTPVSEQIPSGTAFTLKASEVDATYSTASLSYVAENLSDYRIGILNHAQSTPWSSLFVGVSKVTETPTPASVVTATYSTTTTIHDALCVSNPIQLVNALPANPDANTLYLIPEA